MTSTLYLAALRRGQDAHLVGAPDLLGVRQGGLPGFAHAQLTGPGHAQLLARGIQQLQHEAWPGREGFQLLEAAFLD